MAPIPADMTVLRLVALLELTLAWYGHRADSPSIIAGGLTLVPAAFVLRWVVMPSQRAAASAPVALASPAPPPPAPGDADRVVVDMSVRIKAAREQRAAQ